MQTFLFALLLVWPYIPAIITGIPLNTAKYPLVLVYSVLSLLFGILTYLFTSKSKLLSARQLAFRNMLAKLVHLPILPALLIWLSAIPGDLAFGFIFWLPLIYAYILLEMVICAMYCRSALAKARETLAISRSYVFLHIILHFLIIADVISAVCVYSELRKHPELE